MYKEIKFFRDLKDNGHVYKVGDTFPRDGVEVSDARLSELSSSRNRQGTPLIERVPEVKAEPEPEPIEEDVKSETEAITEEVEPEVPKKRGRKKNS